MRRFTILFVMVGTVAWVLGGLSCDDINIGSDDSAKIRAGVAVGDDDDTTGGDLTWTGFAENFVTRYCAVCHGPVAVPEVPYALDSYEAVVAHLDSVRSEVAGGGMPATYPTPNSSELDTLASWANNPTESGWNSGVAQLMVDYCVMCHATPTRYSAPFPLDNYADAADEADDIVDEVDSGGMPPNDDQNFPTDSDVQQFLSWIDAGAPE